MTKPLDGPTANQLLSQMGNAGSLECLASIPWPLELREDERIGGSPERNSQASRKPDPTREA